jgi:hypothetical protein
MRNKNRREEHSVRDVSRRTSLVGGENGADMLTLEACTSMLDSE